MANQRCSACILWLRQGTGGGAVSVGQLALLSDTGCIQALFLNTHPLCHPLSPAGPLGRLVLPPTRTLALVEFLEAQVGGTLAGFRLMQQLGSLVLMWWWGGWVVESC